MTTHTHTHTHEHVHTSTEIQLRGRRGQIKQVVEQHYNCAQIFGRSFYFDVQQIAHALLILRSNLGVNNQGLKEIFQVINFIVG